MDYLARREHSFFELKQKMFERFEQIPVADIEGVLQNLREENLQSDARFTESFVRYRKGRGFGYQHIRSDLLRRHVNNELIERYLFADDADWETTIHQLIQKKLRADTRLQCGSRDHGRVKRFLESRGFQPMEISKALQSYLD